MHASCIEGFTVPASCMFYIQDNKTSHQVPGVIRVMHKCKVMCVIIDSHNGFALNGWQAII